MRRSKYGAIKTVVNGITFDSRAEAARYRELLIQLNHGEIFDLVLQPIFVLIPAQTIGGKRERAVKYVADFSYFRQGVKVVEDVKGVKTREYIIKRKLLYFLHGIEITEVVK